MLVSQMVNAFMFDSGQYNFAENYKETNISTVEINRPGLELTGYLEFFDNKRIQVLGNTEFSYLGRYGPEAQKMVIDSIFSFGPPAVIICRDIEPSNAILESAKLHKVSIFSTPQSTSDLHVSASSPSVTNLYSAIITR